MKYFFDGSTKAVEPYETIQLKKHIASVRRYYSERGIEAEIRNESDILRKTGLITCFEEALHGSINAYVKFYIMSNGDRWAFSAELKIPELNLNKDFLTIGKEIDILDKRRDYVEICYMPLLTDGYEHFSVIYETKMPEGMSSFTVKKSVEIVRNVVAEIVENMIEDQTVNNSLSEFVKEDGVLVSQEVLIALMDDYDEKKPFTCVFSTYAVGKTNQKAYSAAKTVAKSPGSPINPLLIFGSTGLGKTHLIEAIGTEIKDKKPDTVITYKSAEMFRDQLADYIARGEYERFMSRIYSTDILLIDDLQELNTSKAAQNDIITIINHLIQKGSQVVLTCDCPVSDLTWLDSGLKQITNNNADCEIAEIQPPDYDLRVEALKEYAKRIKLDDNVSGEEGQRELTESELEVIHYIANITSDNDLQNNNLSEVLGVFKRLKIACELIDEKMTLDIVKKMLD